MKFRDMNAQVAFNDIVRDLTYSDMKTGSSKAPPNKPGKTEKTPTGLIHRTDKDEPEAKIDESPDPDIVLWMKRLGISEATDDKFDRRPGHDLNEPDINLEDENVFVTFGDNALRHLNTMAKSIISSPDQMQRYDELMHKNPDKLFEWLSNVLYCNPNTLAEFNNIVSNPRSIIEFVYSVQDNSFERDYVRSWNEYKRNEMRLDEISTKKLADYKTAAGKDAKAADAAGDIKKADKRFSGIVKATKKQFDNETKAPKK